MSDRRPFPASLMAEARSLYAAGWSPGQIHRVFSGRDLERVPVITTIRMWVDDGYRERQLSTHRRSSARRSVANGGFKLYSATPEYQAEFINRLRGEGEPWEGVVRVCRIVFDDGDWTVDRAKQLVGVPTRNELRLVTSDIERTAA